MQQMILVSHLVLLHGIRLHDIPLLVLATDTGIAKLSENIIAFPQELRGEAAHIFLLHPSPRPISSTLHRLGVFLVTPTVRVF